MLVRIMNDITLLWGIKNFLAFDPTGVYFSPKCIYSHPHAEIIWGYLSHF